MRHTRERNRRGAWPVVHKHRAVVVRLQIVPKRGDARRILENRICQEAGNFADAIAAAERGLQIIAASANSANGLAMQRRLEGYRRGIPFHQQAQRKEKAGEK